jgi:hypothetical protein
VTAVATDTVERTEGDRADDERRLADGDRRSSVEGDRGAGAAQPWGERERRIVPALWGLLLRTALKAVKGCAFPGRVGAITQHGRYAYVHEQAPQRLRNLIQRTAPLLPFTIPSATVRLSHISLVSLARTALLGARGYNATDPQVAGFPNAPY